MRLMKTIKFILLIICLVYFFPEFNNGIFLFVLKLLFYVFLMYISCVIINSLINELNKFLIKTKILWVDEREHAKANTLANLNRLNCIGVLFRLIHYYSFNKKRIIKKMWYNYLENITIILICILFFLIIFGFIIYRINFVN